ncbi:MAG: hypothetical protein AB7I44_19575 [Hyphomicrobiaceae bacterium]|nr:hypothetical protein [Nitrospirales bacterium]
MTDPIKRLTDVRTDVQKHGPVGIIAKDVGLRVATGGVMVQRARKFKTKWASHHGSVRKKLLWHLKT